MDISIVIPTHDRHRGLMNLIESINNQVLDQIDLEVLVISNWPDPILEEKLNVLAPTMPLSLKYFERNIKGVNSARNLGLKMAIADRVLFLDDDVVLENTHYLKTLLECSRKFPMVAAIGGRYLLSPEAGVIDRAYHQLCDLWLSDGLSENGETRHLVGGNTLYDRQILKEDLYFSEQIVFGGAERELNDRIIASGKKMLIFNELAVLHVTNLTLKQYIKKALLQGKGSVYSARRLDIDGQRDRPFSGVLSFYFFIYDFFYKTGQLYPEIFFKNEIRQGRLAICSARFSVQLFYQRIIHKHYWRVPCFIKWHLVPFGLRLILGSILLFFPFNTIGLYAIYIDWSKKIEGALMEMRGLFGSLFRTEHLEKRKIKVLVDKSPEVNWKDALGESQIMSKEWLIDKLADQTNEETEFILIGGWVGLFAYLLSWKKKNFKYCLNIDQDRSAAEASMLLNSELVKEDKFKISISNALDYDYSTCGTSTWIINTSSEHMADFGEWIKKIPKGTNLALQSNNMRGPADHVNCKENLNEFVAECGLSTVSFAEELNLGHGWARYLVIGKR